MPRGRSEKVGGISIHKGTVPLCYRLSKCVEDSIDVLLATSIETINSTKAQIKERIKL